VTPLAYRIVKQLWAKDRCSPDPANLLDNMDGVHCFEMSEVFGLADDLGKKWHNAMIGEDGRYKSSALDKTFAFLPAPKTWLEWRGDEDSPPGYRAGVLLDEPGHCGLALCTFADTDGKEGFRSIEKPLVIALRTHDDFKIKMAADSPFSRAWQITFILRLYAFLALINSPAVIGRRQLFPHRRLVRHFAGSKFALHPWTEIKLALNKPVEIDDGAPHEPQITGPRALHFCRAHVRIRLGKLEYVTAHWRGNPSVGVKQSRYAVHPGPERA
jgi:hypothetical protein